jgi:hypothetical protein
MMAHMFASYSPSSPAARAAKHHPKQDTQEKRIHEHGRKSKHGPERSQQLNHGSNPSASLLVAISTSPRQCVIVVIVIELVIVVVVVVVVVDGAGTKDQSALCCS